MSSFSKVCFPDLSVRLSVHLSVFLSVPSVRFSVRLSVCPSVFRLITESKKKKKLRASEAKKRTQWKKARSFFRYYG